MLNFTFLGQFVLSAAVYWLKKKRVRGKNLCLSACFLVDIKNFLYKIEVKWEIVGKSGE